MTYSTAIVSTRTNTNGTTHTFSFDSPFADPDDLKVWLVNSDGAETLQVRDTDYTVSATGSEPRIGGSITFIDELSAADPPASGQTVVILRDLDHTQDFAPSGSYPSTGGVQALDRIYQVMQTNDWRTKRAIRQNDTEADAGSLIIPLLADRALMALEFDANGDLTVGQTGAALAAAAAASAAAASASAAAASSDASDAETAANNASTAQTAAQAAQSAAEAAQGAAETAQAGAETAETNAASSASAASSSASNASGSASSADAAQTAAEAAQAAAEAAQGAAETAQTGAETAETNAGSSASAASGSASAASGSASAASSSASAASSSASAASDSADAASASASAASDAQIAAEAAQAAAEAASDNPGVLFAFDDPTGDADPGAGKFRFDNATPGSATTIYVDNADAEANTISGWLDALDDSGTSSARGHLYIMGVDTAAVHMIALVTGSVVDGTGYRKISITPLSTGGTFTAAENFSFLFAPAGPSAGGDVTAGANITDHRIVRGDGGAKGVQESAATLDDSGNLSGVADITLSGTVDGRDVAADGTKLDGIESGADVTDATNVAAAGAAMSGGAFHDGFSDFVADEHVAHSGVTLTAGNGLTGGGDISASRSFAVGAGTGISVAADAVSVTANTLTSAISILIDGGGSAITTGVKGYIEVPFACTITAVRMGADQTGSIVVDIWKDTYANYPPTDADSITASAVPTISAATKSENATLTGWTTSVSAGDILGFNVDSASTVTLVTLTLTVVKT